MAPSYRTPMISFRVASEAIRARLEHEAQSRDLSLSDLIRLSLFSYLTLPSTKSKSAPILEHVFEQHSYPV